MLPVESAAGAPAPKNLGAGSPLRGIPEIITSPEPPPPELYIQYFLIELLLFYMGKYTLACLFVKLLLN
jgi:hypothetical protein